MPYYECVIGDLQGKRVKLRTRAGNRAELLEAYAGRKEYLISFREVATAGREGMGGGSRFSREQVREFTGLMAALLRAGNTVNRALELCERMGAEGAVMRICRQVREGIRRGEGFSESLLRGAPSFSPLYRGMVKIGEQTGRTAEVFERLRGYLTRSHRIRNKVGGALFYPVFVLGVALIGSVLALVYVMPRMAEIMEVFTAGGAGGLEVGGMYSAVYSMAGIAGCGVAVSVALVLLHRSSRGAALALDAAILNVPFVGRFCTALESLDFFFAMELCTSAGMNVDAALGEAQAVLRNRYYARAVSEVRVAVRNGTRLSEAFVRSPFPAVISRWIAVGEETGDAGEIFSRIKMVFEEIVETGTERFITGLEPVLILITGLSVIALIVECVLPLFGVYGAVL